MPDRRPDWGKVFDEETRAIKSHRGLYEHGQCGADRHEADDCHDTAQREPRRDKGPIPRHLPNPPLPERLNMQHPDGRLERFDTEDEARTLAEKLEEVTGKAHPVFREGEVLEIKGGKWKVAKIMSRGRMVLKTVAY